MKKHVFLFASLFFFLGVGTTTLSAQETAIKSGLKTFIEASNAANWDKVLDMHYEKLFEKVNREQIKQGMAQMESMGMKMEIEVEHS